MVYSAIVGRMDDDEEECKSVTAIAFFVLCRLRWWFVFVLVMDRA